MRIMWFAILICVTLTLSSPVYADVMTLETYISQVRQENPNIQSAQFRSKASENRISPAGALDDPFIAMGVDEVAFGNAPGYVTRYQVSQAIPFPGKLSTKSAIAKDKANSASSDVETLGREITVIATQNFFRAYYNQKALELNSKLRKIFEGTIASTKSRYETGGEGHHALLLEKIEISTLDVERFKLQREQKILQASLNELRAKPAEEPLGNLSVKFSDMELMENDQPPLADQPELKSLNYFVMQAEKEEKLARMAYYPDFVIQGMAMDPSPEMMEARDNWGVMVGVSIPLYAMKKQSKLLNAKKLDRKAAIQERNSLENRLNAELVAAKEQLKTAKDITNLYKSTVIPTTNLAANNAKSSYAAGSLPLTEYLNILKVQRTQELEYLAAQIDVELARTRLENILSAPPVFRLAPVKPSLFGGQAMSGSGMGSDTVSMGDGMSGPTRKSKTSTEPSDSSGSGMGGM